MRRRPVARTFNIVALALLVFTGAAAAQADDRFFTRVDEFLGQHVHNGLVDYRAIQQNRVSLRELIDWVAKSKLNKAEDPSVRKAFWLNAYNLLVIQSVVDHYPLVSPLDVDGFFDRRMHTAAGQELTLNDIEDEKIRVPFADARIHFALVCAARSCPPIIERGYTPDRVEAQLQTRALVNLNATGFIRVDQAARIVSIPRIFAWYREDFEERELSVLGYINQYRRAAIPEAFAIRYYTYDWSLNNWTSSESEPSLQAYTPSTLLRPGQVEVKVFNNLYTQTSFFDADREKIGLNTRSTFYTNIAGLMAGVTADINLGFDLYFKAVRLGSSPASVLRFSARSDRTRTALTSIAPKMKFAPLARWRSFSVQTQLLIPLAQDLQETPFLDYGDPQWGIQAFYDYQMDHQWLAYFEHGWFVRFGSDGRVLTSPTKAIVNFYPSTRWTVYLPTEIAPTWDGVSWSSYFFQAGLGGKYLLTPRLEVELLHTRFVAGRSAGAGVTYNVGLRLLE